MLRIVPTVSVKRNDTIYMRMRIHFYKPLARFEECRSAVGLFRGLLSADVDVPPQEINRGPELALRLGCVIPVLIDMYMYIRICIYLLIHKRMCAYVYTMYVCFYMRNRRVMLENIFVHVYIYIYVHVHIHM